MAEGTADANLAITCIPWLECFMLMSVVDQPERSNQRPVAEGTEVPEGPSHITWLECFLLPSDVDQPKSSNQRPVTGRIQDANLAMIYTTWLECSLSISTDTA